MGANIDVDMRALLCAIACAFAVLARGDDKTDTGSGKGSVKATTIGIDLGTTYSCVGVYKNGRVEIIQNDQGNRITPSYVAFTSEGRLIGEGAKNQAVLNPSNTVYDAKRLIGRTYSEESVQSDMKLWPFKVNDNNGKPAIEVEVDGSVKTYMPEEISSMVLTKMKQIAEGFLGKKIENAVVTCPAYFNDQQRKSTRDAGVIAGLNVRRIINEPTAAALAYGLDKKGEKNILVFDLGGGTFDVTILTIENGVFEVIATNGDTHLGGEDFDQRTMKHFVKLFKRKFKKDISGDKRALQKLRRECERAKRTLSTATQTRVEIEALHAGIDFSETLTRAKFEELNTDLFKSTMLPVKRALEDAKFEKTDIVEVVLVGGSSRIPKVRELLSNFFNGKDLNMDVNPDEAVAFGAAVQGGILSGEGGEATKDLVLLDVAPLSLGSEDEDGLFIKIIERNTVIPTKKTDDFTTVDDNQASVDFPIYEGERAVAKANHQLGSFILENIPPQKAGTPHIDVSFDIDQNGILKCSAVEKQSGNTAGVTIKNDADRLNKGQIERMIREAKRFEKHDAQLAKTTEAKAELRRFLESQRKMGGLSKLKPKESRKFFDALGKADDFIKDMAGKSAADFKSKLRETEALVAPITALLYDGGDAKDVEDEGSDETTADEL